MPKYSVERSITIQHDPDTVFEFVSDYSHWATWSPWLCAEPDTNVVVSEDSNSVGSTYAWEGQIVGAGELEHLVLEPGKQIIDEIRFFRPFKSTNTVTFNFEPDGSGTKVSWQMNGALPWYMFWMKGMMESFIGMDYERGLKMMKELLETGKILSNTKILGVMPVPRIRMAGIRRRSRMQEISKFMADDLANAKHRLEQHGVATSGCMSVYHDFKIATQIMDYTSGYMVEHKVDIPGLENWEIDECKALQVDHIGSYEHLGNGWFAANQFARNARLKMNRKSGAFEIYRNDPGAVPEDEILTEIYLPIRKYYDPDELTVTPFID